MFKYQVISGKHHHEGKTHVAGSSSAYFFSPRGNLVSPALQNKLKLVGSDSEQTIPVLEQGKLVDVPKSPEKPQQNQVIPAAPVPPVEEKREFKKKRVSGGKVQVGYYDADNLWVPLTDPMKVKEADEFLATLQ